ncbi:mitochondrial sodium/calcium exchanger protein isoform X2 [Octopus sinensis]|uniref:Mitochondrial sodium/calcium exchanger protein isoform X2 n=1 Tax=Octopus sinensis TaxID=2607531 RepID=A0A6P7TNM0_9MOLL|nr:mitochondrial sodium/calcium exchanger protein isoform X2 [Octopus sinensis]
MVFCRDFHQLNLTSAQICTFIKNVSACHDNSAWFPYNELLYCQFADYIGWGAFLLVLWWLLLFLFLMITSDQFLCQSLQVITQTLHLSQNIAGVTFLAFGNGAPDIFSSIAAVKNAKHGDASLAFGALFGAGLFVTTVVAGIISIIKPFKLMERPFLRDVIFYMVTLFFAFYVLWKKTITKFECIGFILLYVTYTCIVIISRYIYVWLKKEEKCPLLDSDDSSTQSENSEKNIKEFCKAVNNTEISGSTSDKEELLSDDEDHNCFQDFLRAINPMEYCDYAEAPWYWKAFYIIKAPLLFIQLLTIPLISYERPNKGWNRHLNSLHLITGSLFFVLATNLHHSYIGHLPVLVLALLIGSVLAAIVFFTSSYTPPNYYPAFSFLSFLMSVLWIYIVANEVVNLLITFGIVFNMSNVVVGVTFLAWGNSLGDLITDITIAKNNNPRTGISAVYGGQMFNLVLGIGIPFAISTWSTQEDFKLVVTLKDFMLAAFLAFTLVSTFISMPILKFKMNRYFGCYLLVLYGLFSVITLLIEVSVIPTPVIN